MPRTKQIEESEYRKSPYWNQLWYPKSKRKQGFTRCPAGCHDGIIVDQRRKVERMCIVCKGKGSLPKAA